MSEKKAKLTITEIAENLLDGDKLKNFLDFYEFLKNNKLSMEMSGKGRWVVKYKKKRICHLCARDISGTPQNSWFISYYKDKDLLEKCEKYVTDELKKFILDNINIKSGSDCEGCAGKENTVILGKLFTSRVCGCHTLMLKDPDGKTIEYAKEIVLMNKQIAADIAAGKA
jgi:hypothetical protein